VAFIPMGGRAIIVLIGVRSAVDAAKVTQQKLPGDYLWLSTQLEKGTRGVLSVATNLPDRNEAVNGKIELTI
jgi:hypothetical protein